MKNLLIILFLLPFLCHAGKHPNILVTTYYFAASGNDATGTGAIGNPYQTLTKANSISYAAGDALAFNGGDIFYGSLIIKQNNVNVSSYGTGKATITGLVTLASWTNIGGGVWQKAITVKNALNIVTINNIPQEVGRYPNSDATNGGYLLTSATGGNTTVTAPGLSGTNWTGAEIVARKRAYVIERDLITSQSGGTVTYAPSIAAINPRIGTPATSDYPSTDSLYGVFVQRDIRTLDKFGEWFYDSTSHVMSMYFGSSNPASYSIQASAIDTLINIGTKSNITVNNINLTGANMAAVFYHDNTNISITNCTISNTGAKGIFGWYSFNNLISGNTISYSLCGAIDERAPADGVIIYGNTITNTATFKGMASNFDPADAVAIYIQANSAGFARKNIIDSCAYIGVRFDGTGIKIDSNFFNHYALNRDDGGAIYTYGNTGTNRTISNNIILNGIGARHVGTGEDTDCHGIYIDAGGSSDVNIFNNSIGTVGGTGFGIFLNSPKNVNVRGNTVYNANGWYVGRQYADQMYSFSLHSSIFFQTNSSQSAMLFTHDGLNTTLNYTSTGIQNAVQQIGAVDSNFYSTLNSLPYSYYYQTTHAVGLTPASGFIFPSPVIFSTWKSYSGLDAHSTSVITSTSNFQYNETSSAVVYNFLGFSKKDVYGTVYNNSATIPAYQSKILIDNGTTGANIPPVASVSTATITLTSPSSTTSVSGSGTDADGTIVSTAWTLISGTATIVSPSSGTTGISGLVTGVAVVRFTVTDNSSATDYKDVTITVNAANIPPVAHAGTDQLIITNSTTLSGSGTDADGTISSYAWVKLSGSPSGGTITSPGLATTTITSMVAGVYNYQLTVTDNNGSIGKDTVQVTVDAAPVVTPGSNTINTLPTNTATVSVTATDADGTIASYAWTQVSGTAATISSSSTASTGITGLTTVGTRVFRCTVTDNLGATGYANVTVFVNAAPAPSTNQLIISNIIFKNYP